MQSKLKAAFISALFMIAGNSQAAILNGYNYPQGDGELFISIATAGESMVIDTDISLFALRDGSVTGWTSNATQTAALQTFFGVAPLSEFHFNAGGVTGSANYLNPTANNDEGFFLTSNNPLSTSLLPLDSTSFNTVSSNIGTFIDQINSTYADTEVVTGLRNGDPGYHNSNLWSDDVGGFLPSISTEASVGTTLNLWTGYNQSAELVGYALGYRLLGQLSIDTSTGVVSLTTAASAVPLPTAFWLFGSGLIGLLGIARRKA